MYKQYSESHSWLKNYENLSIIKKREGSESDKVPLRLTQCHRKTWTKHTDSINRCKKHTIQHTQISNNKVTYNNVTNLLHIHPEE